MQHLTQTLGGNNDEDIPELYDRQSQFETLVECYKLVKSKRSRGGSGEREAPITSQGRLHLITGSSGTGKSALAYKLREFVLEDGGFFCCGKYDQYQLGCMGSFGPVKRALEEYCRQVLDKPMSFIKETREAILDAVGEELPLLLGLTPTLREVLGKGRTLTTTTGSSERNWLDEDRGSDGESDVTFSTNVNVVGEAQKRFRFVFCKFLQAICSLDCPMVLFLDDMQWMDSEALVLMEAIARDKELTSGLMFLGACRGDEVALDSEFAAVLRSMEDENACSIIDIQLGGLSLGAVHRFISAQLELDAVQCSSLARYLHRETGGNIFAVRHLMYALLESGIVSLIGEEGGNTLVWKASGVPNLEFELETDNDDPPYKMDLVDLVRRRFIMLPKQEKEVLQCMSCLGATFTKKILELALGATQEKMLDQMQNLGIIIPVSGTSQLAFRWVHDKFQEAAYELLSIESRAQMHLSIGRRLWVSLDQEELKELAVDIAFQLTRNLSLIADESDRVSVAELCVCAARNAKRSSEFDTCVEYLDIALKLLPRRHWFDHYKLSFEIYCSRAEIAYAVGDNATTERLALEAKQYCESLSDSARVEMILVYSFGSRNLISDAVQAGLKFLQSMGENVPLDPSNLRLMFEFTKTNLILSRTTEPDIIDLSFMTNEKKLAAVSIYGTLLSYALPYNPRLFAWLSLRLVQLTIKYGRTGASSWGFACLSMMLCSQNPTKAYRYGQLSMRLLDDYRSSPWACRTICGVWAMVNSAVCAIDECYPWLLEGSKSGLAVGDTEFAMMNIFLKDCYFYHSGKPLQQLFINLDGHSRKFAAYGQGTIRAYHHYLVYEGVRTLIGQSTSEGACHTQCESLECARREGGGTAVVGSLMSKVLVAVVMCQYEDAESFCEMLKKEDVGTISVIVTNINIYLTGLTELILASRYSGKKMRRLSWAKKCKRKIMKWAEVSPASHLHQFLHLEAEWAAYRGKLGLSHQKFMEAINAARSAGSLWGEGLICERFSAILAATGAMSESRDFFHKALGIFEKWGATIKVEALLKQVHD